MNSTVPFYANTDKTHCYQATLRMALGHFWPHKTFSWAELDTITAKREGLWSWPTASMLWLQQQGFDIRDVEIFDYRRFAEQGGAYLIELFGQSTGQDQIDHSDIPQETHYARLLAASRIPEARTPDIAELQAQLDAGYLLICNVNSRALNELDGYRGHFVLITGHTPDGFILHDPGPPGEPHRHISYETFAKAWAYPDEKAQNYLAIRLSALAPAVQ